MLALKDKAPEYIFGKFQMTTTVVFTAFFSLVLILLVVPFNSGTWFALGYGKSFWFTVVFYFLCLVLLIFSRRVMYQVYSKFGLSKGQFGLWVLAETILLAMVYVIFSRQAERMDVIEALPFGNMDMFIRAFELSFCAIVLPHIIASQYFAIQEKDNTIRLMNYSTVVSDMPATPLEEKRINLFDNNGVLKFSINSRNLLFIESDDNYIQAWYMDSNSDMKQYMLRCRLKTVEESFKDSELMRCHRKYIVNMSRIRLLKAEKDGYSIELDVDSLAPIPVSKTYEQAVLARFNSR